MNIQRSRWCGGVLLASVLLACSAAKPDEAGPTPAALGDGGLEGGADADAEDAPDAAPSFVFPRAATSGGAVIAKPKIVVITFAGDALEPSIAQYNDALQTSTYFATIGKEYGVGTITSVTHVRLPDAAPLAIDNVDIRAWLMGKLGPAAPLGVADSNTLYAIYYPASTVVTYAGKTSCNGFDGYHGEINASGTKVGFAVLPRCPPPEPALSELDRLTAVASHEYFEWATDPFPQTDQAWEKVVPDSMAWGLAFAAELVDLCGGGTNHSKPADLGFVVQSVWSNQASSAGRAPCQPAVAPLFATPIPRTPDVLTLSPAVMQATSIPAASTVPGVIVAPGTHVDVGIHVYAERKDPTVWQLFAVEDGLLSGAGLTLKLDRAKAPAGEDVNVRVTAPTDFRSPTIVVLYLTRAGVPGSPFTRWPFIVAPSAKE
jgi:hypothetical protein